MCVKIGSNSNTWTLPKNKNTFTDVFSDCFIKFQTIFELFRSLWSRNSECSFYKRNFTISQYQKRDHWSKCLSVDTQHMVGSIQMPVEIFQGGDYFSDNVQHRVTLDKIKSLRGQGGFSWTIFFGWRFAFISCVNSYWELHHLDRCWFTIMHTRYWIKNGDIKRIT